MKNILITGFGKLAMAFDKYGNFQENTRTLILPKHIMDVTNEEEVFQTIRKFKKSGFEYLIHTAAIAKPMSRVNNLPIASISTNIVGTANVARACWESGIKFIYISTDYIYPNSPNPYETWHNNEESLIKPQNKYAWSKLGGECVAQLIPNSLILRCALTDIPFRHEKAFKNVYKNSITHEDIVPIILKLVDETGVINVGGEYKSIFDFVKKYQPDIKEGWDDREESVHLRLNLNRLKNV